jgi:hypothetical protein
MVVHDWLFFRDGSILLQAEPAAKARVEGQ